jgi:cleavage stimulation factor subunit 2
MSSSSNKRTVFVGNIAFDVTDEELTSLFASVGPVNNLRLVHDRDTGKRKGYGFIEYTDAESAASAVRNLHEHELHGRTLRVNIADQDTRSGGSAMPGPSAPAFASDPSARKRKDPPGVTAGGMNAVPQPPPGASSQSAPEALLPPSLDPIAAYVERQGRAQLFEFVQQAKLFTAQQPDKSSSLFVAHPQLYIALQLAVDRLCGPHWPPPLSAAPKPSAPPPMPPPKAAAAVPAVHPKVKPEVPGTAPGYAAAAAAAAVAPSLPPAPRVKLEQPPPLPPKADMDPALRAQLEQLMSLMPEQLAALPDEQRAQVLALQQTMQY